MQTADTYQQERYADSEAIPSPGSGTRAGNQRMALSRTNKSKALFVLAAGGSFLFSVYLWFLVDREQGLFVGLWVPSILALGALLLSDRGDKR
ncbi:MAG: hypothetical protein ACI8QZ_001210 [Chlamydiales bacterium]|jgi:hypothetical protein